MAYTLPYPVEADGTVASGANVTANFTALINAINSVASGGAGGPTVVSLVPDRATLAAIPSPTLGMARELTETGREGKFIYSTTNYSAMVAIDTRQGMYVAPSFDTTGASGAWVRKQVGSAIELNWFGAPADWNGTTGTDIFPAVACAFNLIGALSGTGYLSPLDFRGGPPLHVRYGQYYCSSTWEPLFTGRIYGDGGIGWGAATRINFPTGGVTALRLQSWFTSGASTYPTAEHFSGDNLVIEHISFLGPNRNGTGRSVESEGHGCHAKRPVVLRLCTFDGFEGDGFYNAGDAAAQGTADECFIDHCHFWNNRNGAYLTGQDSNAHAFRACKFNYNRACGVNDSSGLGNFYEHCNFDGNGVTDFSKALGAYVVSNGTNQYCVIDGQEVGAKTNPPPAGATDNQWWYYLRAGGTLGTGGINIPLWTNGMPIRLGAPLRFAGISATNVVSSCYFETIQGYAQLVSPALAFGCNTTFKGNAGFIQQVQGNLHMTKPYFVGPIYNEQQTNSQFTLSGVENLVTPLLVFKTGTTNGTLQFQNSSGTKYAEILASTAGGLYIDAVLGSIFRYNGTNIAAITSTSLDIASGKVLTNGGVQVLTSRQVKPATPTLTDVVNLLVTHGLWG